MQPDTYVSTRDVVSAIRMAFRGAGPCHCHTVAKLGEDEVIDRLVLRQVIPLSDVQGATAITIEMLKIERHRLGDTRLAWGALWALDKQITYLTELTAFTFADLVAINGIGKIGARKIEEMLAGYGLLLRDGDPALLDQVKQEQSKPSGLRPRPSPERQSPEQIRENCVKALMELATQVSRDGMSIARMANQVAVGNTKVGGVIKRYVKAARQTAHEEVRRITASFVTMEQARRSRSGKAVEAPRRRSLPAPAAAEVIDLPRLRAIGGRIDR